MNTVLRQAIGDDYGSPANFPGAGTVDGQDPPVPGVPGTVTAMPRPTPDFGEPARFTKTLNARQLNVALDYLFRLDSFDGDLPVIRDIRAANPRDLVSAEQITRWSLGSPKEFGIRATKNFLENSSSSHVIKPSPLRKRMWAALLFLAFAIPAAGAFAAGFSSLAILGAGLGGALFFRMIAVPPSVQGAPAVADTDWELLHSFVVDSVLASILERRGAITAGEAAALRRGFDHIRFISHTTAAMAAPPYIPEAASRVAA